MIFVQFRSKIIRFLYYVHSFLIKLYLLLSLNLEIVLSVTSTRVGFDPLLLLSKSFLIEILLLLFHLISIRIQLGRPFQMWQAETSKNFFIRFYTRLQIIRFIFLYFRWTRSSPLSASNFLRRHEIRFHHRIAALNRFSTLLLSTLLHPVKIRYRFDSYLS